MYQPHAYFDDRHTHAHATLCREDIITVVFASNEFGHISIDFVLRVEAVRPFPQCSFGLGHPGCTHSFLVDISQATEMNKVTMPGLQTLSTVRPEIP
jgi:hypothetical protein